MCCCGDALGGVLFALQAQVEVLKDEKTQVYVYRRAVDLHSPRLYMFGQFREVVGLHAQCRGLSLLLDGVKFTAGGLTTEAEPKRQNAGSGDAPHYKY